MLLAGRDKLGLPDELSGITFEITENALVTEGPELELALQDIRARGARIAVDDAGAGYAGFAQLVRVRPDIVKLDRSLVQSVDTEPTKAAVIKAFVGFADDTGALICAEGIETAAELHIVTELGAATGQGYLLGRPQAGWAPGPVAAVHDPTAVTGASSSFARPPRPDQALTRASSRTPRARARCGIPAGRARSRRTRSCAWGP